MEITRRSLLKYAGVLGGLAALQKSGLMSLKHLAPDEAEAVQKAMGQYEIKYSADCMCPSECGLEFWVKDGKVHKIYGNPHVPFNDGIVCCLLYTSPSPRDS